MPKKKKKKKEVLEDWSDYKQERGTAAEAEKPGQKTAQEEFEEDGDSDECDEERESK